MQRVRFNGWKRVVFEIIPVVLLIVIIFIDQWSKSYFSELWRQNGDTVIIANFFVLTCTFNTGAAWGFLSDKSWGQVFFKILTVVALFAFAIYYLYSAKKKKTWLKYALIFVIGGTIGNFIDRVLMSGVVDFLSFNFGGYAFPVFNIADSFLTVGVIMLIIYYLFIDENAIFKKNQKAVVVDKNGGEVANEDISDNAE